MKNFYLTLFAVCFAFVLCSGQGTGLVNYNSTGYFTEIIPVEGNNFLAIGYKNNPSSREIFKLDQYLNPLWSYDFPMSSVIGFPGRALVLLNDGNYAVMGLTITNNGAALVFKFSPGGTLLQQKEYTFTGNFLTAFCISAAAGNDPGYVIGGGACSRDNFLIKCSANGTVEWAKEYLDPATTGVKTAKSIHPYSSGYIIGSNVLGVNATDICMFKVNSTGNLLWYKQIKMDNIQNMSEKIISLSNGGLAVLSTDGSTNTPDMVFFMDTSCSNVSYFEYSHPGDTYIHDIVDDGTSGIIGAGRYYLGPTSSRMLYLKLSYGGSITWQKTSRGTAATNIALFYCMAKASANSFAMGGERFNSSVGYQKVMAVIDGSGNGLCVDSAMTLAVSNFDPFTIVPKSPITINFTLNATNVSLVSAPAQFTRSNFCGTVSVAELPGETSMFGCYPNPANDRVYFNMPESFEHATIELMDMKGTLVREEVLLTDNIDISGLPPASYAFRIISGEKVITGRFLKN